MKLILLSIAIALSVTSVAFADSFQIIEREHQFYVAYAPVYIDSKLHGHTDRYGRIDITLPNGEYSGEVGYRGQRKNIKITIDGSQEQKVIFLE